MHYQQNQRATDSVFPFVSLDDDMLIVRGKYQVPSHLYAAIKSRVEEIRPHLTREASYTPEELLGTAYWAEHSDIGQRLVTLCLQELADKGVAQLAVMPCNPLTFCLD